MACEIQLKIEKDLKDSKIISSTNKILDKSKFDKVNRRLASISERKYDLPLRGETLFSVSDDKIIPNETAFNLLDILVEDYVEDNVALEENHTIEELEDTKVDNFLEAMGGVMDSNNIDIPYYELDTVAKKQKKLTDSIKDSLEEKIKKYDSIIKKSKKKKSLIHYNKSLKELLNEIEKYDSSKQWEAITAFISNMESGVSNLKRKFSTTLNEIDDLDKDELMNTSNMYNNFLQAYSLIEDVSSYMSSIKTSSEDIGLNNSDLLKLDSRVASLVGMYDSLSGDFAKLSERAMIQTLNDRKYASEVMAKWRKKLTKEYNALGIKESKSAWIQRQMDTVYKDEIDEEVRVFTSKIVTDPSFDITMATKFMNSSINTNSKMISIMQTMIDEVRDSIIERSRTKDIELKKLFEEFIKEKGNKSPSTLYKNLIEKDSKGNYYLKGEYKVEFREQFEKERLKYVSELASIKKKYGNTSVELEEFAKNNSFDKWRRDNTRVIKHGGVNARVPIKKWTHFEKDFSPMEWKVLNAFRKQMVENDASTYGINSLLSDVVFKGRLYKLPSVTKSDMERVLEGNTKGMLTDKWKDLTSVRPDDIGYDQAYVGQDGNPMYSIRVNYRGELPPSQQSLDLFTLMRLEYKNAITFQENHKKEVEINTLVNIAGQKNFYKTTGARVPILGYNLSRNKRIETKGKDTETYKRMVSLLERNVYSILHKNAGKMGPIDTNKAIKFFNGWTAAVGMTINEVSAVANVLNGKAQLFLEGVAGSHIKKSSLIKAEKIYFSHLKNNLTDVNSPIKDSFVNQVTEMFDTFGHISVSAKQAFIKNGLLKANLNFQSLQFMQNSGEHWMQSVLTIAALDSIKALDSNGNYIDSKGNVVKDEKKAASLFDMLDMKNGKVVMNPKVVFSEKSQGVEWDKGGKVLTSKFIKKKIFDNLGNYDENMQAEAMRHAAGKLTLMYRKYLVPMGIARYRGFSYVDKKVGDLRPEQRFFSDALQEYEEGFYTTAGRFLLTSVLPRIKQLQFQLMAADWKDLSKYEKDNIRKSITELAITSVILPLASTAIMALAGGDDDEDLSEFTYFTLLSVERLSSEVRSYRNINDQYRILESPIPSTRMLENMTNLIHRIISVEGTTERFKSGERKDQLKIKRDVTKLTPILNSTNISYKEKLEFLLNMTN